MSMKLGKVLLFGAAAGVAAYGTYYLLQKKNMASTCCADGEECVCEEGTKKRSYVTLDMDTVKGMAADTYEKAKDALRKVDTKIEESGVFHKASSKTEEVDSDGGAIEGTPAETESFFDEEDPSSTEEA